MQWIFLNILLILHPRNSLLIHSSSGYFIMISKFYLFVCENSLSDGLLLTFLLHFRHTFLWNNGVCFIVIPFKLIVINSLAAIIIAVIEIRFSIYFNSFLSFYYFNNVKIISIVKRKLHICGKKQLWFSVCL